MRRGLTFGKFMPLHRGHQFLIDTALSQCDDLTILVYDSTPPGVYPPMPLEKRLGWVRELYPEAENILGLRDPFPNGEGDGPECAPSYAEQISFLGQFDVLFTSEPSYAEFAGLIGAKHVVVDESRELVPISGTEIRTNVYEARGWMDPLVYSSLIQKVVFVGTESAGKSTLAAKMAEVCDTLWVHEFGRELWEAQGLTGTFADHLKMARRQYQREEAAARQAREFVFCDTNAWTTLQWSLRSYATADQRLIDLVEKTVDEYIWVVCDNDFGWVQDGTRELEGDLSGAFQLQQIRDLDRRGIAYYLISGPLERRVEQMLAVIRNYRSQHVHLPGGNSMRPFQSALRSSD